MSTQIMIGTRKGLFVGRDDGTGWAVDPIRFTTVAATAAAFINGPNGPRMLVALDNNHWGASLAYSDDLGQTWTESTTAPIVFPERTEASLARIWQLTESSTEPGVVYAGVEPAALFRSTDYGQTFQLVEALWDHPHRPEWVPGGGGMCLHTIIPHPTDPHRMGIAVSTAGFYRTSDGGASWEAANRNIRAPFLPEGSQYPEFGQCVHKVAIHPDQPDRLFLQHHWGVYVSEDFGTDWQPIGESLPSDFGFPIAVAPENPDTVYVFPLHGDYDRTPVDHRYRVFRSDNAGGSWRPMGNGLPDMPCYPAVLRDAMSTDSSGVYFGTRGGSVYAGSDGGEKWTQVATQLPDVLVVRASTD